MMVGAMKVVAFISDKGGMGKSTAALNLACAAVEDRYEAAVLDLDPQASVGRWARVRRKADLPPRPLAETCVPIDIEDRLAELRAAGADLVLLDTAGRDNNAITAAIAAADLVLVPCHPTDLELSTLGPTFAAASRRAAAAFRAADRLVGRGALRRAGCDGRHRAGGRAHGAGHLYTSRRLPGGVGAGAGRHRVPALAGGGAGNSRGLGMVAGRTGAGARRGQRAA